MFEITHEEGEARVGRLRTAHGTIETPFSMPVATKGTVKYLTPRDLEETGAKAIISNSLILALKPGTGFIKEAGGIHKFIGFPNVIFTDSGGFQMQSETLFMDINDKGVRFRNPYTKQKTFLTPEDVMKIENEIGADIAMCLDQMPHTNQTYNEWAEATKRTHLWAERCKKAHATLRYEHGEKQLLFGIAQGGLNRTLRKRSAEFINKLDFDGVAMGGLCLGESDEAMYSAINDQIPVFNKNKPRYLMGVGSPIGLIDAIANGVDCFDSIYPTQNARHCNIFTSKGLINLKKGKHAKDFGPLDEECGCYVCKNFSKAFLRHLMKMDERTVNIYLSCHNVHFNQRLVQEIRESIKKGEFSEFRKEFLQSFAPERPKPPDSQG